MTRASMTLPSSENFTINICEGATTVYAEKLNYLAFYSISIYISLSLKKEGFWGLVVMVFCSLRSVTYCYGANRT
jgi:hypothetical protein